MQEDSICTIGVYSFKNYVSLDNNESKQVLSWRNHDSIRKKMYNTGIIKYEDHLHFLSQLCNRKDCSYWMVYMKDTPYGTVNFVHIDDNKKGAELGYLISPDYMDKGGGLAFLVAMHRFAIHLGFKTLKGVVRKSNIQAIIMEEYMGGEMQEEITLLIDGKEELFNVYERDLLKREDQLDTLESMRNFMTFYKNRNNTII